MRASIVIPVYNQLKMTIDCLSDLQKTYGIEHEVIVVDDGSKEPVAMAVAKMFPTIKVLKNEQNLGFAQTVNKGILAAQGDIIVLLNNDIRLHNPAWLKIIIENMEKKELFLTAPAGGRMTSNFEYIPGEAVKAGDKFAYLVGWCLAVRKEVFTKIGLIPTNFQKGYFEDVLFGFRSKKAGFKQDITEGTGIEHLYHQTFKAIGYDLAKEYREKRAIFLEIAKKEGIVNL
jgi:GT2 family glycosyltransferase